VKKDGIAEMAQDFEKQLRKKFNTFYDQGGAIGRRYRRMDEAGTPFCICLDYDTKEDETVTVRDRDTMEQVRMPMSEVAEYIQQKCTRERD
jgi:glycyl-tRNA synthetase